jgi:hypothetical protein
MSASEGRARSGPKAAREVPLASTESSPVFTQEDPYLRLPPAPAATHRCRVERVESTVEPPYWCFWRREPPCQSSTLPTPSGSTPRARSAGSSRSERLSSVKLGKVARPGPVEYSVRGTNKTGSEPVLRATLVLLAPHCQRVERARTDPYKRLFAIRRRCQPCAPSSRSFCLARLK